MTRAHDRREPCAQAGRQLRADPAVAAIFYPDGFTFPLVMFDLTELGRRLTVTEIGREAATLVLIGTLTADMLYGVVDPRVRYD